MEDLVLQAANKFIKYWIPEHPDITEKDVQTITNISPFNSSGKHFPYDIILNLRNNKVYHIVADELCIKGECEIGDRMIIFRNNGYYWDVYLKGFIDGTNN